MSLQLIAKQMEAKGRNGDSVLVHMTHGEVAGLQKLAENAGGSLSVNPETGLVEASFLKSILPTLVGAGVSFMTANPYLGAAAGAAVGGYQARRSGQDVGMGAITGGLGGYGGFQLASGAGLGKAAGQALTGKQMFQSGLMALAPSLNVPMPQQQSPYPLMSADINQSSIPFQNIQAYAPPMPRYTGGRRDAQLHVSREKHLHTSACASTSPSTRSRNSIHGTSPSPSASAGPSAHGCSADDGDWSW